MEGSFRTVANITSAFYRNDFEGGVVVIQALSAYSVAPITIALFYGLMILLALPVTSQSRALGGPSLHKLDAIYRPDIDVLRAIAVLAVVLFHWDVLLALTQVSETIVKQYNTTGKFMGCVRSVCTIDVCVFRS